MRSCCALGEVPNVFLEIVALVLGERGQRVLVADVSHEFLFVPLVPTRDPRLHNHAIIWVVGMFNTVKAIWRAVKHAALIWVMVDHGVTPLTLSCVDRATSPWA